MFHVSLARPIGVALVAQCVIGTAAESFIRRYSWVTDGNGVHVSCGIILSILPTVGLPVIEEASYNFSVHILTKCLVCEENFSLKGITPVPVWQSEGVIIVLYLNQPKQEQSVPGGKTCSLMSKVSKIVCTWVKMEFHNNIIAALRTKRHSL